MDLFRRTAMIFILSALALTTACGNRSAAPQSTAIGSGSGDRDVTGNPLDGYNSSDSNKTESIWTIFGPDNSDVTLSVNKYLWAASLDVLNFLPIQTVDPFSGVISTGYGTPPGGGQSYRATVYIRDAALDARSLSVAMQTRNGRAVSEGTTRAVEDAILTRARQIRIDDSRF
ncbi:DUF3576 domain-containing protein [Shimia haliotis]|uniref:DUF3576 domain-containing protein n=1 Tax=Shimia haliotis TaxID=1280847 RepID=A0A1I4FI60_9RHOB|nr:DUF3576 domain-containing protein [Shimia haliotis]SFL17129.1 protein of unknown function [Shimia haliotis]